MKHVVGDVVGRWTLAEKLPKTWRCVCACGVERVVDAYTINAGRSKSCGCLRAERLSARSTTHGASQTKLYRVWAAMKDRCGNPNDKHYPDYGGRGIRVCSRWADSFEAFKADVGDAPGERLSLDRVDNEKGYEPGNVKWSTPEEQARNRRTTRKYGAFGETLTVAEWAERHKRKASALKYRVTTLGMTMEEALTKPSRYSHK